MDSIAWHQRQPMLPIALAYTGGVVLGWFAEPPLRCLATTVLAFALAAWRLRPHRHALLAATLFTSGWLNVSLQSHAWHPHDLRLLTAGLPEIVTLRGQLAAAPEIRESEFRGQSRSRSLAKIQVGSARICGRWQPARGRVLATIPGVLPPDFFAGRTLELEGVLHSPDGPAAPGLFDYRRHLAAQGVHFLLRTDSPNDWRLAINPSDPQHPPLHDRFQSWGRQTLARGLPEADPALRLQQAMVLGWRTGLTDELKAPFMRSGTMHIFAISGLHVVLAAGILTQLLRSLQLPRWACALTVGPALWFYTAATGWQSSAIRSALMMTVILGGQTLHRPADLLNSLATAAVLILAWDPLQLFTAGFQLSFFVVLALALLLPPLERCRDRWLAPDPLLPESLRPWWQERFRGAARWTLTSAAVSLAAWLGSLPLIALYFHLVTPVSLFANLIVVPLSGLVLMCGLGSLACGAWSDALTLWFNHAGWFFMHGMLQASRVAADLPGAWFPTAAPHPALLAAYYASLLALATGWVQNPRRAALLLSLLGLVIAATATQHFLRRTTWSLTALALRSGEALLIRGPDPPHTLLVDVGDEASANSVVAPYLRSLGLRRLPALLLTHGDIRHVGGTPAVLESLHLNRVVAGPFRARSRTYRDALQLAQTNGATQVHAQRGDGIGSWEILHPSAEDRFTRADDQALVLRATPHGVRVLICGDLGPQGQAALLAREPHLACDVLFAGINTASESLSEAFLDAAQPRVLVLASSEYPASQLPSRALRHRLHRRRIPILFLHETGTVQLTLTPRGATLRAADGSTLAFPPSLGAGASPP